MTASAPPAPRSYSLVRFWMLIGCLCGLVLGGSWWLTKSLQGHRPPEAPLPVLAQINGDLEATERSGAKVHLSSLKGTVRAIAYVYTVCPHGCVAIVGEMLKLQKEFASHKDFRLVSVSVVPERDTPEFLSAFADATGLKRDAPWWFLTGDRTKLWGYMTHELKLTPSQPIPEEERLNPLDLYMHDLRIVLVDRQDNVRGYYAVLHPQPEIAEVYREKLHRDVQRLLDEPLASTITNVDPSTP